MTMLRRRAGRVLPWLVLGLLCLISASRWLIENAYPATVSTLAAQAVGCVMAGGGWIVWSVLRGKSSTGDDRSGSVLLQACGVVLLLTGPVLAQSIAGESLGSNNATLALTLTPVVLAVLIGALGNGTGGDITGQLWPGLAAIAGLLLLVPEPSFAEWRPWAGLAALPCLAASGAALFGYPPQDENPARVGRAAVVGVACLLAGGITGLVMVAEGPRSPFPTHWVGAGLVHAALVALSLISLWCLGVSRWSAQFLLIPLLTVVEGMVLLRPALDARSWIGLGLLALGAGRQLVAPADVGSDTPLELN